MPISSSVVQTLTNSVKDTYVYPRTLSSAVTFEAGNSYGGSANESLDTTLSRVVFLNTTQTISGAKTFSLDTTFEGALLPSSTNTKNLGSSSRRWSKLYIGTTDTYGSSTQPIYWNAGTPTACTIYAGGTAVTLNNTSKAGSTASFYAPTTSGTANQLLVSGGSGTAPSWKATANGAAYATSANGALTFGTLPVAQGGTGATSFTSGAALIGNGTGAITTRSITSNTSATSSLVKTETGNTNLITMQTLAYALNRITGPESSDTNYSTKMMRAIYAGTNDIGVNGSLTSGAIYLVYET